MDNTADNHLLCEELYRLGMKFGSCPTAPGFEYGVKRMVLEELAGFANVTVREDEFGNIIARYVNDWSGREPVRLVAHMDHPGFVVRDDGIFFRGGMKQAYFPGQSVCFYGTNGGESLGSGKVVKAEENNDAAGKEIGGYPYRVEMEEPAPAGAAFGVWDLPGPSCTKRMLEDPTPGSVQPMRGDSLFLCGACDDLVEVTTMVALLQRLAKTNAKAYVEALFTRAEEVGFYGALAALESREPLVRMVTISLEVSPAGKTAEVGGGPILRVGDRMSAFDYGVTIWAEDALRSWIASEEERMKSGRLLPFQRKLMAGGRCEASVFMHSGFPTGGICIPMYNGHNMGLAEDGALRLDREAVSLKDWQSLYDGLHFLVTQAWTLHESRIELTCSFKSLRDQALKELL